jgi:hypothetical protein
MRAYIFLETKTGSYLSVIQTIIDMYACLDTKNSKISRPLVITGNFDIVFKMETKNENTLFEEMEKILANPATIEKIISSNTFIVAQVDNNMPFIVDQVPTYIMFAKTIPGLSKSIVERVRKYSEVIMANLVNGIYDLIIELKCDADSLSDVIFEIQKIRGILKTSTVQVLQ